MDTETLIRRFLNEGLVAWDTNTQSFACYIDVEPLTSEQLRYIAEWVDKLNGATKSDF